MHPPSARLQEFSDYIVYVDESGSPHMPSVDPGFPLFVLAFCIFEKRLFAAEIVPALASFKFKYFGHDQVVLHEREIRKRQGPFVILNDRAREVAFHDDLTRIVETSPFTIVAVVLDKAQLVARSSEPPQLYEYALMLGLERVCMFLKEHGQGDRTTHVIFEHRGKLEDQVLELEFRRLTGGANSMCSAVPVEILFAHKRTVSTGLQIADLVARPIGNGVIRPLQSNRALAIIRQKLRRGPGGEVDGYGLKIYPR